MRQGRLNQIEDVPSLMTNYFEKQQNAEGRKSAKAEAERKYPEEKNEMIRQASRLGTDLATMVEEFRETLGEGSVEVGWNEKGEVTKTKVVTEEGVRAEFERRIDNLRSQLDTLLKLALLAEKGGESVADLAEEQNGQ